MRLFLRLAVTCVSENVENLCSACILSVMEQLRFIELLFYSDNLPDAAYLAKMFL